jgi:hypothetical protein
MTIHYRDFLSELSEAKDNGKYITGLCPFHDDTNPSLLVFKDGWWRCLGCTKSGRWLSLWNKLNGQDIIVRSDVGTKWRGPDLRDFSSLEDLCYQAHRDLLFFSSFKWYLEMRGVSDRVETCDLGYYKGWYTIPVRDADGEFKTCVFRSAPHVQQVSDMRYWCPSSAPMMYVPDYYLLENAEYVVVTFGIFDALALSSLRIPAVTSTYGKDSFKAEWLDDYRVPVYICPDKGEEMTAYKLRNKLGWRGAHSNSVILLDYPNGIKDPAGYLEENKRDELLKSLSGIL